MMKPKSIHSFEDLGKALNIEPLKPETIKKADDSLKFLERIKKPHIYTENRKKGKTVTIIKNLNCNDEELKLLIQKIKKSLGIGGLIEKNYLVLQGSLERKARSLIANFKF